MNTRLASRTLAIALACSPIAIHDCYAARIYNNLDYAIKVDGSGASGILGTTSVQIGPKQRSASLEWTNITEVFVSQPGNINIGQLCDVGFGAHYQIQGGNYMVVSRAQNGVSCVVYDSNHHPIAGR